MKGAIEFWKEYIDADCLEKRKLLNTLPLPKDKDGFYESFTPSLLKSYLDDLIITIDKSSNRTPKNTHRANAKILLLQILLALVSIGAGYMLCYSMEL